MKIFYAVQATGNGHISRAMELLPHIQKYGEVDIFLSGSNSSLELDAPIKYRSKGLSLLYTCNGSLNYTKTLKSISPYQVMKDVKSLPVEKYDMVINDFDCITTLACKQKNVKSINFGHQASFLSDKTPRPEHKSAIGEWVLKNFGKATHYVGLHFDKYDDFILPPVIKRDIWNSEPQNKGYITVYLPSYCNNQLQQYLSPLKEHRFEVFSWQVKEVTKVGNIKFIPVNKEAFNQSLIHCEGIITGAGFETPAEALYLKKKIIAIPIKGQYEQMCNGAALEKLGVKVLEGLEKDFERHFNEWFNSKKEIKVNHYLPIEQIVDCVFQKYAEPVAY